MAPSGGCSFCWRSLLGSSNVKGVLNVLRYKGGGEGDARQRWGAENLDALGPIANEAQHRHKECLSASGAVQHAAHMGMKAGISLHTKYGQQGHSTHRQVSIPKHLKNAPAAEDLKHVMLCCNQITGCSEADASHLLGSRGKVIRYPSRLKRKKALRHFCEGFVLSRPYMLHTLTLAYMTSLSLAGLNHVCGLCSKSKHI